MIEGNARFIDAADREPGQASGRVETAVHAERGATLVTVYAKDQPGLFYRIAGAISLAGGNIIDARIHTTDDGMALDNFLVQDMAGARRSTTATSSKRLEEAVLRALEGQEPSARPARRAGAAAAPRRGLRDPAGRVRR